jgi:glutathione peroxidase-family protein
MSAVTARVLVMSHLYDLTMRSINGDDVALAEFRGKVLLVVNVASL